jgi:hypothetical protein
MDDQYRRELKAKAYLDKRDADPSDSFSYERNREIFEAKRKRRESAKNKEPRNIVIDSKQLCEEAGKGQGNFRKMLVEGGTVYFDISESVFDGSIFKDVKFENGSNLQNTSFFGCTFIHCKFEYSHGLNNVGFDNCKLIATVGAFNNILFDLDRHGINL